MSKKHVVCFALLLLGVARLGLAAEPPITLSAAAISPEIRSAACFTGSVAR